MIKIYAEITIDSTLTTLDNAKLLSLQREIKDRGNIEKPNWGVYSNTGNIEFIDYSGTFLNYANARLLTSDIPLTLKMIDTISGKSQSLGDFLTDKWNYDTYNAKVKVSIKDELTIMQNIWVDKISYDSNLYASEIYDYLKTLTPSSIVIPTRNATNIPYPLYSLLDSSNGIKIQYGFMKADTLWNCWDKLCKLCMMYMFNDTNANVNFSIDWSAL